MGRPYIPSVERFCEQCGKSFMVRRYLKTRFCSRPCVGAYAHSLRKKGMRGADNPRYNHGLCLYDGRWIVTCADRTITHYARCVMAAHIGRLLRSDEIVHHINGDPLDDCIENLTIVSRADHAWFHGVIEADARKVAA